MSWAAFLFLLPSSGSVHLGRSRCPIREKGENGLSFRQCNVPPMAVKQQPATPASACGRKVRSRTRWGARLSAGGAETTKATTSLAPTLTPLALLFVIAEGKGFLCKKSYRDA